MPTGCTETNPPITPTRCVECPEIDPILPSVTETAIQGWNAGANSVEMLAGDVQTVFTIPAQALGIVIGFKQSREFQTTPALITHGIYFTNLGGFDYWYVSESMTRRTTPLRRNAADEFRIRRIHDVVRYYCNGLLVYTSAIPSVGPVLVNACLFATGDQVA